MTLYHPDHTHIIMDFSKQTKTVLIQEKFSDYYSGICPFCGCKVYKIIDSKKREIQEIGGPNRKVLVELEYKRVKCLNTECNLEFTPEHPMYPKNHTFSRDIIEQSLNSAHRFNKSAENIALELKINNSVDIHAKTIQLWINSYSEEYFQTIFAQDPKKSLDDFKAITIDGTWFDAGKKTIGKKKIAQFSSVTKLTDGTYLLTWWT
jgi:hypothetical protein